MEQEYKTSTGYKIFYGLGIICLICFTIYLSIIDTKDGKAIIILPLLGIIVSALVIVNLSKRKVIISDYSVKYISIWGSKEIVNKDVKGYRVLDKRIVIYPLDSLSSKINIKDYSSIGDSFELIKKLSGIYTDLDAVSYQDNINEIYNNNEFGNTKEDRISALKKSKRTALIYNCGGILIFIISLIFTEFILKDDLIKIVFVLYPIAGIILLILSKGLIKLVSGKNSAFGSLIAGMYTSTIASLIIFITHYDFVTVSNLCLPVLIISVVIGIVVWKYGYDKSENAVKGQLILLILISIFYACPLTMFVNCKLDASAPTVYKSKILGRDISHNNGRNYCHITISTWGAEQQYSPVLHIDQKLYDNLESEQFVNVNIKHGLLNIPWFYVTE